MIENIGHCFFKVLCGKVISICLKSYVYNIKVGARFVWYNIVVPDPIETSFFNTGYVPWASSQSTLNIQKYFARSKICTVLVNRSIEGVQGQVHSLVDSRAEPDIAWGLYFSIPNGGGSHPLMVHHSTKDHLCSIISWPIRWQGYDTLQMILSILGHHGRVTTSPDPLDGI